MHKFRKWITRRGMESALYEYMSLFTEGFIPSIKRITDIGVSQAIKNLRDSLREFKVNDSIARQSLTETLLLNPNVDLSGSGKFIVKEEHKGFLLESLVKSVIGNTPYLGPEDFREVASFVSDGKLFEDGIGFPVDKILTPIERVPGRELGDREYNYWIAEREKRPPMALGRKYWYQAEHNLITKILNKYVAKAKKGENLEVGAGWGDFYWLAPPEFRDNMICVEWNQNFINGFKERFPEADIRKGNIYKLNFPDESFSNVVGLTPFSSLYYLDYAIAELWRVLKPGGRFFSFQDLTPNDDQVVEQLLKRGLVPDSTHVSFFRGEKDREKVADAFPHASTFNIGAWKNYREIFNKNTVVQNLYEYHELWLATELKYRGFRILHQKDDTGVYIGPREERHKSYCPKCQMDCNRDIRVFTAGNPRGPFMEPHPINYKIQYKPLGDYIVERVIIWVTVAEKPKEEV